jgi:hypothetical protein
VATGITAVLTANYTATSSDVTVRCDTSGGGFTVTLPAASGVIGQFLFIKLVTGGSVLTVDGNGSDTIDGDLTVTTSTTGSVITLQAVASGLWVVL